MYKSLNEQANSRTTKEIKNNKTPQRGVREEQLERAERVGMCRKKLRCALPGTVIELPHPAKTDLNPTHWMAELTPILLFLPLFFLLSIFSDRERQDREEAGPMYKKNVKEKKTKYPALGSAAIILTVSFSGALVSQMRSSAGCTFDDLFASLLRPRRASVLSQLYGPILYSPTLYHVYEKLSQDTPTTLE